VEGSLETGAMAAGGERGGGGGGSEETEWSGGGEQRGGGGVTMTGRAHRAVRAQLEDTAEGTDCQWLISEHEMQ
jgi:hypothetical protein